MPAKRIACLLNKQVQRDTALVCLLMPCFLHWPFTTICTSEVSVPYFKDVGVYVWEIAAAVQYVTLKMPTFLSKRWKLCQFTNLSGSVYEWGWHHSSKCQLYTIGLRYLPSPLLLQRPSSMETEDQMPVAWSSWMWLLTMFKYLLAETFLWYFLW